MYTIARSIKQCFEAKYYVDPPIWLSLPQCEDEPCSRQTLVVFSKGEIIKSNRQNDLQTDLVATHMCIDFLSWQPLSGCNKLPCDRLRPTVWSDGDIMKAKSWRWFANWPSCSKEKCHDSMILFNALVLDLMEFCHVGIVSCTVSWFAEWDKGVPFIFHWPHIGLCLRS